jgi:hypothetical protein
MGAGLVGTILLYLGLKKKIAQKRVERKTQAFMEAEAAKKARRQERREARRALMRTLLGLRPKISGPVQQSFPQITEPKEPTIRKVKIKTRGTPTPQPERTLTPPTLQPLLARDVLELNGVKTFDLVRKGCEMKLTLLKRVGISHSPPPQWRKEDLFTRQYRVTNKTEDIIRHFAPLHADPQRMSIPFEYIATQCASARAPPTLVVLNLISRIEHLEITGLPKWVADEVKSIKENNGR